MRPRKLTCPHNEGIGCYQNEMHCKTCGWNPKVAKERLSNYYEQKNIERAPLRKKDTP